MPAPRKSVGADEGETPAPQSADAGDMSYSGKQAGESETLGLDNFELPRSVVGKLAKAAIPGTMQIRKEAQSALIRSSSVFINYLSAAAQDRAIEAGRKTLSGADVLQAVQEIEMPEEMHELLVAHLQGYKDLQQSKRAEAKAAAKRKSSAVADAEGEGEEEGDAEPGSEEDAGRGQGGETQEAGKQAGDGMDEDEQAALA